MVSTYVCPGATLVRATGWALGTMQRWAGEGTEAYDDHGMCHFIPRSSTEHLPSPLGSDSREPTLGGLPLSW